MKESTGFFGDPVSRTYFIAFSPQIDRLLLLLFTTKSRRRTEGKAVRSVYFVSKYEKNSFKLLCRRLKLILFKSEFARCVNKKTVDISCEYLLNRSTFFFYHFVNCEGDSLYYSLFYLKTLELVFWPRKSERVIYYLAGVRFSSILEQLLITRSIL